MKSNPPFHKSPAALTIAAGLLIGGVTLASVRTHGSSAPLAKPYTAPSVTVASEKLETLSGLRALDDQFTRLAEFASPAVVSIRTKSKAKQGLMGQTAAMEGEGSGVIFRPDGYIITNDHVVNGADEVTVVLHDGREFKGKATSSEENDIAVVKIDAKDLPTLQFSDSTLVKPGQNSMAIGAPMGLENSVTIGHVSATKRDRIIPDQHSGIERRYYDLIQTDTPINMGNSGGPLINIDGEVIGINSAIFSMSGGSQGLGFSISSNTARMLAETLIEKGKVVRGYLGAYPEDIKEYRKKELKVDSGAVITRLPNDGPAAMAGLKNEDIIVRIGSLPVRGEVDLRNAMFRYQPGQTVDIEVVRDGQHKTYSVKIGAPQPTPAQKMATADPGNGFDFKEIPKELRDKMGMPDKGGDDTTPTIPHTGKAKLGIQTTNLDEKIRSQFHIPAGVDGAVVMTVIPGSTADRLGLQPGDLVQAIGQTKVKSSEELIAALGSVNWGDTRKVTYSRFAGGASMTKSEDVKFK